MTQQRAAIGALEGRIGIGKVLADVTQRHRAEQGVAQCVQQHITVGMSDETEPVGNPHATEGDEIAIAEAVYVIAMTDTHKEQRPEKVRAQF